jgi:hypothetical protein
LPVSVESTVVQEVLKRHTKWFNKILWNGQESLAAPSIYRYFDGFIKNAMGDADVIDVPTPATLSASNIVAELEEGYALIPEALKYDPEMKIFVSYATYDFYMNAQINQTYKGNDFTSMGVPAYKGLPLVKIADFPNNVYMIAKGKRGMDSNLWVGLNSVEDASLQLQRVQANSELFFIKMLCKADVQIGWGAEVVLYGTI